MPFANLFNTYSTFMRSESMRHEELIQHILSYAKQMGLPAVFVVQTLHNMYLNH